MSKQEQKLIEDMQDLIAQVESDKGFATKQQIGELTKDYIESYEGSDLDLFIVCKRIDQIVNTIMDSGLKEDARAEHLLVYGNEKADHKGISITPIESHERYDYPQDKMLAKYEEDVKEQKKKIEPFEKKLTSIEDSIKERQQELVDEGKATKTGSSKYLRVNN